MKSIPAFFTYPLLLCFVFFAVFHTGCPQKKGPRGPFSRGGEMTPEREKQNEEAFEKAIVLFNTLEETPILRGLPGASLEQQTVSRLDKWIANREGNKLWKEDPLYAALSESFAKVIQKMKTAEDMIPLLQSDDENTLGKVDSNEFLKILRELPEDFENLSRDSSIDFSVLQRQFKRISDQFQRTRNVREISSLTRVEQVNRELRGLTVFREYLSEIAELFNVKALDFQSADADHFKQSVWCRNISTWARGSRQGDLDRATALFDWTVRNIDLRPEQITLPTGEVYFAPTQEPWQTLLLGAGSGQDRAWVFIELLRQQRIDAALIGFRHDEEPEKVEIWSVGVLSGGEIYLFLPSYGVAIPGPSGLELASRDKEAGEPEDRPARGEIVYRDIATLSQVLQDDGLLRNLDIEGNPYPLRSEMLKNVVVRVVCPPCTASQRMSLVQNELSGEESMVLYQAYQDLAERFSKVEHVQEVKHWLRPLEALYEKNVYPQQFDAMMLPFHMVNPKKNSFALWAGRVLYFKGMLSGEESAITFYRDSSISHRELEELKKLSADNLARADEIRRGLRDPQKELEELQKELQKEEENQDGPRKKRADTNYFMTQDMYQRYLLAKRYAKFWIGIVCYENGKITTAIEHFEEEEKDPMNGSGQLWSRAISYNLARAYEKMGLYDFAIDRYGKHPSGPASRGNLLRAKWLKELLSGETVAGESAAEETEDSGMNE